MKKLTLIIAILFSGMLIQAQTDLVILDSIIGKPIAEIEQKLNELNLEYYITLNNSEKGSMEIYIQKENSVRSWAITYSNYIKVKIDDGTKRGFYIESRIAKVVVVEVFVRYRHSNIYDLREFFEYETPINTENCEYEKSNGSKLSHLKAKLLNY